MRCTVRHSYRSVRVSKKIGQPFLRYENERPRYRRIVDTMLKINLLCKSYGSNLIRLRRRLIKIHQSVGSQPNPGSSVEADRLSRRRDQSEDVCHELQRSRPSRVVLPFESAGWLASTPYIAETGFPCRGIITTRPLG